MQQENVESSGPGFANRLKHAMSQRKLDGPGLAKALQMDASTVYRWMGGKVPRSLTLIAVAKVLGVSHRWLEEGLGQPIPFDLRLDQAMEVKGVSAEWLGRATGTTTETVKFWLSERDDQELDKDFAKIAAAKLGVNPDWLIDGVGPMSMVIDVKPNAPDNQDLDLKTWVMGRLKENHFSEDCSPKPDYSEAIDHWPELWSMRQDIETRLDSVASIVGRKEIAKRRLCEYVDYCETISPGARTAIERCIEEYRALVAFAHAKPKIGGLPYFWNVEL